MARRGAIEMVAGATIGAGKLTRAVLQALGLPVGRIGLAQVGAEELAEVPWDKVMAGTLAGTKRLLLGPDVEIASSNYTENAGGDCVLGWRLKGDGQIKSAGLRVEPTGPLAMGSGGPALNIAYGGDFKFGIGGAIVGITPDGKFYVGGADYASAVLQVDAAGNFILRETAQSMHHIPIGALDNNVLAPEISPSGGAFDATLSVSMFAPTQGAAIYYTLDGSAPSSASTLYSAPITLSATTTVKAIAVKAGFSSGVTSKTFTKNGSPGDTIANPYFTPFEGNYTPIGGNLTVLLRCTVPGSYIRYNVGTVAAPPADPTTAAGTLISPANISTPPSGSFVLTTGQRVVKAIAYKTGPGDASGVVTATYIITVGGTSGGGGGTGGWGPFGRGNEP